jgi:glycosyltransferase involved in cell wall biosynthesis
MKPLPAPARSSSDLSVKVMLLTNQLQDFPLGGRALLCKLNHDVLKDIYGERLVLFELPKRPLHGLKSIINAFRGHIDGLSDTVIRTALKTIEAENVGRLFVDGSNLGGLVKVARRRFPELEISTFFHNVEARFFLGSFRQTRSLRALAVLLVNYLAERKAVRYSDKIICLSERDSRLLQKLYGRGATHVAPMAMKDMCPAGLAEQPVTSTERYALFVGGGFYANRAGICWFVENIVPRIGIRICIVGRGLDDLKLRLEREGEGRVTVVGAVDDLADWYRNAHFVIAPIFDGSGMKTKVAEALMFGKKIVGTPEAFSGYESVAEHVGWVCATTDEFVAAIRHAEQDIVKSFNPELRALYQEKYSFPAARLCLAEILRDSRPPWNANGGL